MSTGTVAYAFSTSPYRIVDIAVSPDATRLVCLGEASHVHRSSLGSGGTGSSTTSDAATSSSSTVQGTAAGEASRSMFQVKERCLMVFNLVERRRERILTHPTSMTCITFADDDSRHALVNQAPDVGCPSHHQASTFSGLAY